MVVDRKVVGNRNVKEVKDTVMFSLSASPL